MSEHTPGPWYANRRRPSDLWKVHANETNVVANVFGTTIKCDANSVEQQEANARLIAAAPELLAALREVKEQAYKVPEPRDGVGLPLGAWELVLHAIAKAEGAS